MSAVTFSHVPTPGQCLEEAITSSFVRTGSDGSIQVEVRSHSSDRYKTIRSGPGRLITSAPNAIRLGEVIVERGGDRRCDESWETSWRQVRIEEAHNGFVAYATDRSSTGCRYSGGQYIVPIIGQVPVLEYGTAYARWAETMDEEAYNFLDWLAEYANHATRRSLRFAAGRAHPYARHDQRREAWKAALRGLGVEGDVSRITGSVRTATVKAALRLDWEPSAPKPQYWQGLPKGIVEIAL